MIRLMIVAHSILANVFVSFVNLVMKIISICAISYIGRIFMILSLFTEVFTNKAGNYVFHVKKTDQYYLISEKNINSVGMFQNLLFNSISVAIIIGWLAKLSYWLWVVIGLFMYMGFTVYFNKKILPQLPAIKNEKAKRKKEIKFSKGKVMFEIVVFFAISIGLIISLFYEPLNNSKVDDSIVLLGAIVAIVLGIKHIIYYNHNK